MCFPPLGSYGSVCFRNSGTPAILPRHDNHILTPWARGKDKKKRNFDEIGNAGGWKLRGDAPSGAQKTNQIMFITGLVGEAQKKAQRSQHPRLGAVLGRLDRVPEPLDMRQV